ncbi:MAG TPA: VWA domain-containing protein, partial [Pyrinomonadaceae bacterium]|nr:VWA domain-containing protein [Pyrinomonadaceae bacterium]
MLRGSLKKAFGILIAAASLTFWVPLARGQQGKCLTDDEVKSMLARLNTDQGVAFNTQLRDELLKLKADNQKLFQNIVAAGYTDEATVKQWKEARASNTARLCQLLKASGWPTVSLVGQEGVAAAFFLLKGSESFELQRELFPVVVAAVKKGEIEKADFAGLVDRLRLRTGLRQLFGTQVSIVKGFLVLYPIEDEAHVDARRAQYGLIPLTRYLRAMERSYQTPLIKAPAAPVATTTTAPGASQSVAKEVAAGVPEAQTIDEGDVIRVDTSLVNLNVSVYNNRLKSYVGALEEKDFSISEDGHAESIAYFASTDVPFDLVLLLDLSGSTSGKRDLIRKTARRFIEAARPTDRLAIVTFYGEVNVVSPLTGDREELLKKVKKIDGRGGSNVWGALKFTLDRVLGEKSPGRRRAVVLMSDGVDSSLYFQNVNDSYISFADLIEAVRHDDALIIPIYLDTEADGNFGFDSRAYENARKTLALLAE